MFRQTQPAGNRLDSHQSAVADAAIVDALGHRLDTHDFARRHAREPADAVGGQDIVGAEAGVSISSRS
jgi:hypothetical protein